MVRSLANIRSICYYLPVMPKIKTNRTAYKKFKTNAKGKLKRGPAFHSHNTAKKSPKRRRQGRGLKAVSVADVGLVKGMLRYLSKHSK